MGFIKWMLKKIPKGYFFIFKKIYIRKKIKRGTFVSEEKEFSFIDKIVKSGDKVVDIGANIGHYTVKFSNLVGEKGRVISFEPVPETFEILSYNANLLPHRNITLINGAVSGKVQDVKFTIPGDNYYQSHMDEVGNLAVMAFPLEFFIPENWSLSFIKIDAEGCDELIINSSINLINQFRPVVMSEINQETAEKLVKKLNKYSVFGLEGSHNKFLVPNEKYQEIEVLK